AARCAARRRASERRRVAIAARGALVVRVLGQHLGRTARARRRQVEIARRIDAALYRLAVRDLGWARDRGRPERRDGGERLRRQCPAWKSLHLKSFLRKARDASPPNPCTPLRFAQLSACGLYIRRL